MLRGTIINLLIFGALLFGQIFSAPVWESFDGHPEGSVPEVILNGNRSYVEFSISIPGVFIEDTTINEVDFQILTLPNESKAYEEGKPMLPFIGRTIAIDPKSDVVVSFVIHDSITLENFYIFPVQEGLTRYDTINPPFVFDTAAYSSDKFYPFEIVSKGEPAIFRDLRVMYIRIMPFKFNPVTKTLIVYNNLTVTCNFTGINTKNSLNSWPPYVTTYFANIYKLTISNYELLSILTMPPPPEYEIPEYLIIAEENFITQHLLDFAFWKFKKGYGVHLVKVLDPWNVPSEPITDWNGELIPYVVRDTLNIKNCISTYYNQYYPSRLKFVLLVGDIEQIPVARRQNPRYPPPVIAPIYSDYWYSCINGDDEIADIAVGRFSADSSRDVFEIIQKIEYYERNPYFNWIVKRHDLVSYKDNVCHNCQVESVMPILNNFGFPYFDDWGYYSTNQDVINHINSGVSVVTYVGHGDTTKWGHWSRYEPCSFTNDDIRTLSNNWRYPIVFEKACLCGCIRGKFEDIDGHSETWLITYNMGGAGALGATMIIYADPDDKFTAELYRTAFNNDDFAVTDVGWIINLAKFQVMEAYGWGNNDARTVLLGFHYLGDSENDIYTSELKDWTVTARRTQPRRVKVSVTESAITPVENALVCLVWYEDSYQIRAKYTDESGDAYFEDIPQRILFITVTKRNFRPYEGQHDLADEGGQSSETSNYELGQPRLTIFSNPSARQVKIRYLLPFETYHTLKVFDNSGRLVQILKRSIDKRGSYITVWDKNSLNNRKVSPGIYFIQLHTQFYNLIRQVIVLE